MDRVKLIQHLEDNDCEPTVTTPRGQLYKRGKFLRAVVPNKDDVKDLLVVEICVALKIAPPDELEDFYYVFQGWRNDQ